MDDADVTGSSIADLSGRGDTGTFVNSPTSVSGHSGQARSFVAASSQYLKNSTQINAAKVTVAAWVYLTAYPTKNRCVLTFSNGFNNGIYDKNLFITSTGKLLFYAYDGSTKTVTSSASIPLNQWALVGAIADGTTAKTYINSVTDASISCGDTYTGYTGQNVFIGAPVPYSDYADFIIDDVYLWNIAKDPIVFTAI